MTREFSQHSTVAQDFFGRDSGGYGNTCLATEPAPLSVDHQATAEYKVRRPSFSEDLWLDALRRHNDSRQSWRQLLDRFVKPHH